jgi:branched-subunit amino acid transport protein
MEHGGYDYDQPVRVSSSRRRSWFAINPNRIWLTILLFGIAAFLVGLALDVFLIHQKGLRPIAAAAILNAVFAVFAALLVHRLLAFERERSNRMLRRLEIVYEMNHHIRNALQVIAFSTHGGSTNSELAEIDRAVTRIQWAVREILPKVEPEFAPFEGSARNQGAETKGESQE